MAVRIHHTGDDESRRRRGFHLAHTANDSPIDTPRAAHPRRALGLVIRPQGEPTELHASELAEHALDVVRQIVDRRTRSGGLLGNAEGGTLGALRSDGGSMASSSCWRRFAGLPDRALFFMRARWA